MSLPTFDANALPGGAYITFADASGALRVIAFDCTVRVLHSGTATVTEKAVDAGAAISDHIRPENRRLTLEVEVTNTPLLVPAGKQGGVAPLVLSVNGNQLVAPVRVEGGQASTILGRNLFAPPTIKGAEYAAVQDTVTVNTLQFTTAFDRVREVSEALEDLRLNGTTVAVTTKLRQYPQMAIASISEPEEAADSIVFTIELVVVRLAQSETVEVQPPTRELRSKKKVTAGTQTGYTMPENQQSGLAAALNELPDGLKKYLKGF